MLLPLIWVYIFTYLSSKFSKGTTDASCPVPSPRPLSGYGPVGSQCNECKTGVINYGLISPSQSDWLKVKKDAL